MKIFKHFCSGDGWICECYDFWYFLRKFYEFATYLRTSHLNNIAAFVTYLLWTPCWWMRSYILQTKCISENIYEVHRNSFGIRKRFWFLVFCSVFNSNGQISAVERARVVGTPIASAKIQRKFQISCAFSTPFFTIWRLCSALLASIPEQVRIFTMKILYNVKSW